MDRDGIEENKNFSVDYNVRDMIILLKQVLSVLDPNYTKVIIFIVILIIFSVFILSFIFGIISNFKIKYIYPFMISFIFFSALNKFVFKYSCAAFIFVLISFFIISKFVFISSFAIL